MVLAFFLFTLPLSASNEIIKKAEMTFCDSDFCVKVTSDAMFRSALGSVYAFGPSDVEITFKGDLLRKKFEGFEGSYHFKSKRIYIEKTGDALDYSIDMKKHNVVSFKK